MEIIGGNMDEKVSVSIREIENGFIIDRSWNEGKGDKRDYKNEQVFIKTLPAEISKMFKPGSQKGDDDIVKEMADALENKPKKVVKTEKKEEEQEPPKKKMLFGKGK